VSGDEIALHRPRNRSGAEESEIERICGRSSAW
jgi:hypothetical protein